jgi:hypothetical protein
LIFQGQKWAWRNAPQLGITWNRYSFWKFQRQKSFLC